MSICVVVQLDGTLAPTGQPVSECTGYVLVSGSEHAVYALVDRVFSTPTPEQAGGWFVGCFGAVVLFYVVARMAGGVIAMFKG